jgi:hypothetical protein
LDQYKKILLNRSVPTAKSYAIAITIAIAFISNLSRECNPPTTMDILCPRFLCIRSSSMS